MSFWIQIYRKSTPSENQRLNELVIDARVDYEITCKPGIAEALDAIKKITEEYPAPYTLFCSGGVDSQAMLWAWHISGVPFRAVHYSYNNLNDHDTDHLKLFCDRYNIHLEIINFDPIEFWKTEEYIELAKKVDCASPHILTYIKMASFHKETCILAGNFLEPEVTSLNYTILGLDRYRKLIKPNFLPFFFLHTPELAYSFLKLYIKNVDKEEFRKDIVIMPGWHYQSKCVTYQQSGFPVIPQEAKQSGFEKIKDMLDSEKVPSYLRLKYHSKLSKRPMDLLYRYALHDHIGDYTEKTEVMLSDIFDKY